ncbi:hypothetical protein L6164_012874 [Bauhinia variegata]|uniref:Uncharacterized protein n=1 Tax=Bauhinia variegata TaxID=167791 RepID=A0ACB9PBE9_BAUVA|nr:hypothetical protein L6164_012874 [Bauhinia variegata]
MASSLVSMPTQKHLFGQKRFEKTARKFSHGNSRGFSVTATLSRDPQISDVEVPVLAATTTMIRLPETVSSDPLSCRTRLRVSPDSLQYPPGFLGVVPDRSDCDSSVNGFDDVKDILSSKVYEVAVESPLQMVPKLSKKLGVDVWLKREDFQHVFSFKVRGAYNMMSKLPKEQLKKGVISSSAGNHAQGVALVANKLGCSVVIAMPITTQQIKREAVEALGATVVFVGDTFDEAQAYAKKRAIEEGRTFVPAFDHRDIIMGQGTVGVEIMRQMQDPLHAIFVPVGGGGLIAGIAAYVKRVFPQVKVIGVEPTDANSMALSLFHGERVILDQIGGFADGVAIKEVGEEPFRLCKELIDGVILVSRDLICASMKDMFEENRTILEPAGALAIAGAQAYCKYYGIKGENIVAVASGANINFDTLKTVAELANLGRKQEVVLATAMPEKPGIFKHFCKMVGSMNITEIKYRYNFNEKAVVLYSVGFDTDSDLEAMLERMESSQFRSVNFTENDLVKDHLRHMVGGQSKIENEVLCRFIFPDRPGALMKFLDFFSPRWNITSLHHRAQGETEANVLVGMQIPGDEMDEFHDHVNKLGYDYRVETNEDLQLLLY